MQKKPLLGYDSTNPKIAMHYFCTIFWAVSAEPKFLWYSISGEKKLRQEKSEQLKAELKNLSAEFEIIETQIANLKNESEAEKEMRHLARLIYAGKIIEKSGLLYTFYEQTLFEFLTTNKNDLEKPPK